MGNFGGIIDTNVSASFPPSDPSQPSLEECEAAIQNWENSRFQEADAWFEEYVSHRGISSRQCFYNSTRLLDTYNCIGSCIGTSLVSKPVWLSW